MPDSKFAGRSTSGFGGAGALERIGKLQQKERLRTKTGESTKDGSLEQELQQPFSRASKPKVPIYLRSGTSSWLQAGHSLQ